VLPREGPAAAKQLGRNAVGALYLLRVSGMLPGGGAALDQLEC